MSGYCSILKAGIDYVAFEKTENGFREMAQFDPVLIPHTGLTDPCSRYFSFTVAILEEVGRVLDVRFLPSCLHHALWYVACATVEVMGCIEAIIKISIGILFAAAGWGMGESSPKEFFTGRAVAFLSSGVASGTLPLRPFFSAMT